MFKLKIDKHNKETRVVQEMKDSNCSIEEQLEKKRRIIDRIDKVIIRGIVKRTQIAKEIGNVKAKAKGIIYRPDREKKIYAKIEKQLKRIQSSRIAEENRSISLKAVDLMSIYREITSLAKSFEGGLIVHYLGPEASFSHLAVRQSFGHLVKMMPQMSILQVFQAVSRSEHHSTFGIVPIDNTVEGSIGLTLDALYETDLKIFAEKYIYIKQCLIAKSKIDMRKIRKIYTVKVAFDQCRQWLMNNLSMANLELIEVSSTSRAAQIVAKSRSKNVAAIASHFASDTYGLKVLAENIQDVQHNITRFIEIAKNQCPMTNDDKTSIAFIMPDKPGQLAKILQLFSNENINLTKVESRINKKFLGSYVFFVDFMGHVQDKKIKAILAKIYTLAHSLKILGSYPSMSNYIAKK